MIINVKSIKHMATHKTIATMYRNVWNTQDYPKLNKSKKITSDLNFFTFWEIGLFFPPKVITAESSRVGEYCQYQI